MNSLLTTLIVVGCFGVLCSYSYGRVDALRPHPIAIHIGEPDMDAPATNASKVLVPMASSKEVGKFFKRIMKEAKAHEDAVTIAKIYGVTPQNIDADIFGGAR